MGSGGQGTGVVFEFEQAAINGKEMPAGLSSEDQNLFLSLRMLYYQVRIGLIDRNTGIAEKKKLVRAYNDTKRVNAFGEVCRSHSIQMWREIEGLKCEFRKNPSLDVAARMVDVIDGIKPKGLAAGGTP